MRGVNPKWFFLSSVKVRHRVISMFMISDRPGGMSRMRVKIVQERNNYQVFHLPASAAKCNGVFPSLSALFASMLGS